LEFRRVLFRSAGATNEIGIVLYPGVQAACVHGLTDLFEIAANIARDQQRDGRSPLRVTHWQPAHNHDTKLSCVYDSDPRGSSQPQILIIHQLWWTFRILMSPRA